MGCDGELSCRPKKQFNLEYTREQVKRENCIA
jgi:hypothetical protein